MPNTIFLNLLLPPLTKKSLKSIYNDTGILVSIMIVKKELIRKIDASNDKAWTIRISTSRVQKVLQIPNRKELKGGFNITKNHEVYDFLGLSVTISS